MPISCFDIFAIVVFSTKTVYDKIMLFIHFSGLCWEVEIISHLLVSNERPSLEALRGMAELRSCGWALLPDADIILFAAWLCVCDCS